MKELCFTAATRLARLLRARKVSATEVAKAFIAQIERLNPKVNALVTFLPELALKQAKAMDRKKPDPGQVLWGLPIAFKDTVRTKGVRTTFGSPIYAEHVPDGDDLLVERLRAAGVTLLGKTNTPELAAGSQTFNPVFGATRNPYDLSKTCGGSSGGAAVAVACGMLPFADGADLAASLRNPGGYCNIVGFRPSTGRVPQYPAVNPWSSMTELGPLARSVEDCALLLSAMAGQDPRAPTAIPESGAPFRRSLKRNFAKTRVAWSRDLGGLPVERAVTQVLEPHRGTLRELGCVVEDGEPDFSGATQAFEALRATMFAQRFGHLLEKERARLKPDVIWNIEQGLKLAAADVGRAEALRSELFQRMRSFLERYEFLACPVSQLPPYPVKVEWPREVAGERMHNYLDWMKSCYYITVTGHPAVSVPAGFTPDGLPVGIQIVGRYRDDFGVLQLAHAFESATGYGKRRPSLTAVKE